jgi:hypothetical protein
MPNKIEKLPDGNLSVELETGEKFTGDALAVTEKMAEAHVNTKRWGQEWKQKAETPHQQPNNVPGTASQQPMVDPQEKQLQDYLLNQTAKALGYDSADQYKADLMKVRGTTEKVNNQLVATEFLALNQDFPNTPESVEALSKKIDEMGWGFDQQSMTAAHALLVREHGTDPAKGYAPLTAEQINSAWANNMQQASRPGAPPMIHGQSPDAQRQSQNEPWNMKMDELRAAAIKQQLEGTR